jgi:hypothetical protein
MSLKKMADKTYLTPTVQHSLNGTQTQLTLMKNTRQNKHLQSLKIYVYRSLLNGYGPDQIAGSIKLLYPNDPIMSISYEAIYQRGHRQSILGKTH